MALEDSHPTDGNTSRFWVQDRRRPLRGSMSSPTPDSASMSQLGGGFTWALNSRENQLTPWSNDPVADRPGEALYLRDRDSGELWGPTSAPLRDDRAH